MITINFKNKDNPDYESQLTYLIRREFYVRYYKFLRPTLYLIASTLILFGLIAFTPSQSAIILKVIFIALISLIWFVALLFGTLIVFKWLNRYKWKRDSMEASKKNDSNFTLSFDTEKIYFEAETYKIETSWDYYAYWTENKKSIFLFPRDNLYGALFYSEKDLGRTNYAELKSIAAAKLERLEDANGA